MPTPKISNHLLICVNLYQHAKNQLIPSIHSWDTFKFSPGTWLATPICDHAQQNFFWSAFNFCKFVLTHKKWGFFGLFLVYSPNFWGKKSYPIPRKYPDRQNYIFKCSRLAFKKSKIQSTMSVKPKIIASHSACKKSAQFINSFLRYSRF